MGELEEKESFRLLGKPLLLGRVLGKDLSPSALVMLSHFNSLKNLTSQMDLRS